MQYLCAGRPQGGKLLMGNRDVNELVLYSTLFDGVWHNVVPLPGACSDPTLAFSTTASYMSLHHSSRAIFLL